MVLDCINTGAYVYRREQIVDKFSRFVHDLPFFDGSITYCPEELVDYTAPSALGLKLARVGEGVIASEALVRQITEIDNAPIVFSDTSFSPINKVGTQSSRHGVFFGNIALGSTSLDVAVKPFEDIDGKLDRVAIEEVANTHIVRNHGFDTFEPIAIGRYFGVTYCLYTLQRNVATLDSIDWTSFHEAPYKHPGMIEILSKVAISAAGIHAQGWGHGDLYPRNIALGIRGNVFMIDWESASLGAKSNDPETRFGRALTDTETLVTSFFHTPEHPFNPGIGLLPENEVDQGMRLFKEFYFNPYFQERARIEEGTFDDLKQLSKELESIPALLGLA